MGTRTVFELSDAGERDVPPNVVLFANSSHPTEDPREAFRRIGQDWKGPTAMLEALLAARYETNGGNHRRGDRMFSVVEGPYGDCEAVHTAHWGSWGGMTSCRITTSEEVPTLASLRPRQVEALSRVSLAACREAARDDAEDGARADATEAVDLLDRMGADVSEHRTLLGTGPAPRR